MIIAYCDGACFGNPGPMGIGVVITRNKEKLLELSEYIGNGTNNIAEYTAVVRALEEIEKLGEKEVTIRSDSQLIIRQLNGEYKVKEPHLLELKKKVDMFRSKMKIKFEHVPREENSNADELSKQAIENANNR